MGKLSGGNVQKVLLARELTADASVAILNKPTYGLDLHNQRLALERIDAAAGAASRSFVISTDLDELLEISDRIGVMFQGRLVGVSTMRGGGGVHRIGHADDRGAALGDKRLAPGARPERGSRQRASRADPGGAGARRSAASFLLALGKDPLGYYGFVLERSLLALGRLQETLTRMAPLLLIAAGLIVAFRAGIWNLGGDGQFLLAAVAAAALGAGAQRRLARVVATLVLCMTAGALVGALWSLAPAMLKARYGVNEIITTLMMSFLGVSLAMC